MSKQGIQEVSAEVLEEINEFFENGHMLMRLNHFSEDGEHVHLEQLEPTWLTELHPVVDLLSPALHNTRNLLYMYTEEMIKTLPQLKSEGKTNEKLTSVLETLLMALDYITHERFINAPFGEEEKEEVRTILKEVFQSEKSYVFSSNANRPVLNTSELYVEDEKVMATDKRTERNRLYMAVAYRKNETQMDRMRQLGHWMGELKIPLDRNNVSYEEMIEGKTNVELHEELVYVMNRIRLALAWFFNSYSWRNNELIGFDEFDIASKTRI